MNTPENRPGGYFILSRSIFENPQFRGPDDVFAAIWLIAHAAWDTMTIFVKTGKSARIPVKLERGQLCYSMRFLSTKWEYSLATVQRRIDYLSKNGMIEIDNSHGITVITLTGLLEFVSLENPDRGEK